MGNGKKEEVESSMRKRNVAFTSKSRTGKGQRNRFMNLSFVYYNFIVAEEPEIDKRCKI